MNAPASIVEVSDLTVEYVKGDYLVRPIDGMNLELAAGSLALLLGPSGCGKTTMLSCLGGILPPTSGSVTVAGTDVWALAGRGLDEYRLRSVGFVFQDFNLVASMPAVENVMVPLRAGGMSRRDSAERALGLLERVGLADRVDHRPGDLSGGQQQRVAIARALAMDPPLILADEPTAHLDYIQVEGVLRILRGLADEGRVIVVSTHDERLLALADELIEMQPRFLADGDLPPHEVVLGAGDTLFRQGDPGERVYIVDEGAILVERAHPDGSVVVLARLGAGDYVGEMGPMFGLPRSATVRTETGATLTGLSLEGFRTRMGVERAARLIGR